VIAECEKELIRKLTRWKDGVEGEGMKLSKTKRYHKTKVMVSGEFHKEVHNT